MSKKYVDRGQVDPWAKLAKAILVAGKDDLVFINSDWADTLRLMCKLDLELHDRGIGSNIARDKMVKINDE